jgi:hypothetical protein
MTPMLGSMRPEPPQKLRNVEALHAISLEKEQHDDS